MTELSPAAQAVWDAAYNTPEDCPYEHDLAAALEAAADQVVPYLEEPNWGACDEMRCDIELYTDHMRKRSELLAIAAELRGDTTTTETP
jgi:hypothetical protein